MGAVFSQLQEDNNEWHPIAFYSKSMDDAQRNYNIWDKEMLAIIRALEEWRHYILGLPKPVEIWSDHKNLEYWATSQHLSRR
jgi:biotin-(acetyl-CoA carboxylase) ligase